MPFGSAGVRDRAPTEAEAAREVERITDVRQSARGYANYQDWIANTQLEQRVSLEDYSVSNRGLRAGLVGTPEQVAERILRVRGGGRGSRCCCSSVRSSRRWSGSRKR